jgi:anti-anti-sigma regulatory factor
MQELRMLAVEAPARGVRVMRIGGALDVAVGRQLAALAEVQFRRVADEEPDGPVHLLIDLAAVRSFEPGGVDALLGVRNAGRSYGVQVHVTGLSGRQLPDLHYRVSCYPTVECAMQVLAARPVIPSARPPLPE